MKRITRAQGELFKNHGAKYHVPGEIVYLLGTNLFLYVKLGQYYLANTSEINLIQWHKKGGY